MSILKKINDYDKKKSNEIKKILNIKNNLNINFDESKLIMYLNNNTNKLIGGNYFFFGIYQPNTKLWIWASSIPGVNKNQILKIKELKNKSYLFENNNNIVKILLEAGADPNILICNTPLIFSVYMDVSFKKVDLLLRYGALIKEFYKYRTFFRKEEYSYFIKILAKRRWVTIKCVTLILGIHKRAVVTANHPDRLLQQGVFEIEIQKSLRF